MSACRSPDDSSPGIVLDRRREFLMRNVVSQRDRI